jgi:hypothetical protein
MILRLPEDHVVVHREANTEFISRCRLLGATVPEFLLNKALLNARKAGLHKGFIRLAPPPLGIEPHRIVFASELAARALQFRCQKQLGFAVSIDYILCQAGLRGEFDRLASTIYPGASPYQYRVAAFAFRKAGRKRSATDLAHSLPSPAINAKLKSLQPEDVDAQPGVYVLVCKKRPVFCSWALNLHDRMVSHLRFGGETVLPYDAGDLTDGPLEVRVYRTPRSWHSNDLDSVAQRERPEHDRSLHFRRQVG